MCFLKDAWSQLQEFEDPDPQESSECLPNIVMRGKAPATTWKYTGALLRWATQRKEISVFPVKIFHRSLYLSYLLLSSKFHVSGTSWESSPNIIVLGTLYGLRGESNRASIGSASTGQSQLARDTTRKELITVSIVQSLVEESGGVKASLSVFVHWQFVSWVLQVFIYDEIAGLKDIQFLADHVEMFIELSKTDQFTDGSTGGDYSYAHSVVSIKHAWALSFSQMIDFFQTLCTSFLGVSNQMQIA